MPAPPLLLELLAARIRRAGGRWWLVAAGIAVCGLLPVISAASTVITAQAALERGLAALPPGERSVIVSYNGTLDEAGSATAGRLVRGRVPELTSAPIRRQLIFRPVADGRGGEFALGAADALASAVRLTTGRLPARCDPTRCEVVLVRGTSASGATTSAAPARSPSPALAELGLVVVGEVTRSDPLLLSGTFDPGRTPLLMVDGVDAATRIERFELLQRSYGWVAALEPRRVGADGVADWVRRSAQVHDALWLDLEGLFLTTPDDVLREQDARARASGSRFAVLGGATGVLLLGVAVAGGAAVRQDHRRFAEALRRRGAGRRRLLTLTLGEVVATVATGLAAGQVVAAALVAAWAARAGLPAGGTAAGAVWAALPAVLALTLVAGALLSVVLLWPPSSPSAERVAWRVVDALAVGCLVVAVLLAGRGGVGVTGVGAGVGAGGGADGGSGAPDPLLPLLPGLVLLAAALLAARAWPAVIAVVAARLPRRAVAARLGLSGAGARPLLPVATAAVLTAAVAATVFAAGYRATLERGAADQAAFEVPLDWRVRAGASLQPPLSVDSLAGYAAGSYGDRAFGVLHAAGSVRRSATQADAIQLAGVDPAALPRMTNWSALTGGGDPAGLERTLDGAAGDARQAAGELGVALGTSRQLTIRTPGPAVRLAMTAWVRAGDGRTWGVPLRVTRDGGGALSAQLPEPGTGTEPGTGLRLVAIEAQQAADEAMQAQHGLAESGTGRVQPAGRLVLGDLDLDGRPVPGKPWNAWTGQGLTVTGGGTQATLDYRLTAGSLVLGPAPVTGTVQSPLPVITDRRTADEAPAGRFTVVLDGAAVPARVVGVLARFPGTTGRFLVADRQLLAAVLDRTGPGGSQPDEVWIAGRGDGTGVQQAARAGLDVVSRAELEAGLRADPVAVGAARLLVAGAVLTLLVGAAVLVLLVVGSRREDAAELYSWEADGVAPRTLRAALWWRAVAVAAPAAVAGVPAGLALTAVVARLVAVTATAGVPRPPLTAAVGWAWAGSVVGAGLLGALLAAGWVCSRSLREPYPVRSRG